jgi:hypothetical protein
MLNVNAWRKTAPVAFLLCAMGLSAVERTAVAEGTTGDAAGTNSVTGGSADLLVLPRPWTHLSVESRYDDSNNSITTPDAGISSGNVEHAQVLSEHIRVFMGRLSALNTELSGFDSGLDSGRLMNVNLISHSTLALALPYSAVGAAALWMPVSSSLELGLSVTTMIVKTTGSLISTGFEGLDKTESWNTEAGFRYSFGSLPGEINFGGLWSLKRESGRPGSPVGAQAGEPLSISKTHGTWAAYWSAWQYVYTKDPGNHPVNLLEGQRERHGVGFFSRFGIADKNASPTQWAFSGGIGGRGMFLTRGNDTFGIGGYFNRVQDLRFAEELDIENSIKGFECFYNVALTPTCHVTLDFQEVQPLEKSESLATVIGIRAHVSF